MRNSIVTTSRLSLTPTGDMDIDAIGRLYVASDPSPTSADEPDSLHRIRRLIEWSRDLQGRSGGLWSVRAAAGSDELLGCALVQPAEPSQMTRIAIALEQRLWGTGYALDVARELLAAHGQAHWTSSAELMLPPRGASVTRVTLPQLLTAPERSCESATESSFGYLEPATVDSGFNRLQTRGLGGVERELHHLERRRSAE